MIRNFSRFAVLLSLILTLPVVAAAQNVLEQARQAYYNADFQTARSLAQQVIDDPEATREALRDAYALQAVFADAEGRGRDAADALSRAIALDSGVRLEDGVSPALQQLARTLREGRSGDLGVAISAEAPVVTAVVENDGTPAIVTAIELDCDGMTATGRNSVTLRLPANHATAHCEATAVIASGASVASASMDVLVREGGEDAPTPAAPSGSSPLKTVGIVATAVGGAALVGAAVVGGLFLSEDSAVATRCGSEAPGDLNRTCTEDDVSGLRTLAVTGDVLLGAGLVVALTGVVLWIVGGNQSGDADEASDESARVQPWVNSTGGGATASFRF